MGASFQLSFAAVVALIAIYEANRSRWREWHAGASPAAKVALYLAGVALTSAVAGLATAPFSLFSFQQVQWYGVLANMVAVPITAFWVMPWAILACAMAPVGMHALPMEAMGWGISAILFAAEQVASLPGAVSRVPAMPGWGLGAITIGGLWLTLWRRSWRWFGSLAIAGGLFSIAVADDPDIIVSGDGKLVATRGSDGTLALLSDRAARYTAATWLRRDGQDVSYTWPKNGMSSDGSISCDSLGCLYRAGSQRAAIIKDRQAVEEDCRNADLVIGLVALGRRCRAPTVIDWFDLRRDGAHAFYLRANGIDFETVRSRRGDRPWSRTSKADD